jgi:hypothetical protein
MIIDINHVVSKFFIIEASMIVYTINGQIIDNKRAVYSIIFKLELFSLLPIFRFGKVIASWCLVPNIKAMESIENMAGANQIFFLEL